jgi:hypothetical protein
MPYFTQDELAALIPEGWLTESLDDDASGDAESFAKVRDSAENAVNAPLSQRYATPVVSTPLVKRAALLIAAETCYARRAMMEKFPYAEELADLRKTLHKIGDGEKPLTPVAKPSSSGGAVISQPSRVHSHRGHMGF